MATKKVSAINQIYALIDFISYEEKEFNEILSSEEIKQKLLKIAKKIRKERKKRNNRILKELE